MAELIIFPDAEDLFRRGINAAAPEPLGPGVTAYVKPPGKFPQRLVVITRTGGLARDMVTDDPQLSFDVYARSGGSPDESAAVSMAGRLRAWCQSLEREGELLEATIYEVSGGGPYKNPDPRAPSYARFTFTITVAIRGTVSS